jgi:predicted RNase H-like HicB family nuclease
MTMFAVIYERAEDGSWWARAADLPVFSCADSREEVEQEIRAGIAFHLEGMLLNGEPLPSQLSHDAGMVRVELPAVVPQ